MATSAQFLGAIALWAIGAFVLRSAQGMVECIDSPLRPRHPDHFVLHIAAATWTGAVFDGWFFVCFGLFCLLAPIVLAVVEPPCMAHRVALGRTAGARVRPHH